MIPQLRKHVESARANRKNVLCVCLSPGLQHTYVLEGYHSNEVNRAALSFLDPAGKGINVCRALTRMGIPAIHLGQGGANSVIMDTLSRQEGIPLVQIPSSRPLRTCSTVVVLGSTDRDDSGMQDQGLEERILAGGVRIESVTELVEEARPVDPGVQERLLEEYESLLSRASVVCISGSRAHGFDGQCIPRMVRAAHDHAVPVFLDVRSDDLLMALKEEPALVKINLDEFLATFLPQHAGLYAALDRKNSREHLDAVKEVLEDLTEYGNTGFVITRGPRHVLMAAGGQVREMTVPRLTGTALVNPIGSGDAFLAGMAALRAGMTEKELQEDSLGMLARGVEMGILCGQSSARTLRPSLLSADFPFAGNGS